MVIINKANVKQSPPALMNGGTWLYVKKHTIALNINSVIHAAPVKAKNIINLFLC